MPGRFSWSRLSWVLYALLFVLMAGCGGTTSPGDDDDGTGSGTGGGGTGGGGTGPATAGVRLIAESTSLPSAATLNGASTDDGIQLTALVTNSDNAVIENADVTFSATSGVIREQGADLVPAGTPSAIVYTGGDAQERTITVTASSGGYSDSIDIQVTGTELSLTGPSAIPLGGSGSFTATLTDSSGNGIPRKPVMVKSNNGNLIGFSVVETNSQGVVTFTVTGGAGGTDIITASALDGTETADVQLVVQAANFDFIAPPANTLIELGDPANVIVHWSDENGPVAVQTVRFSSSRGTFADPTVVTNASGEATAVLSSNNAGPATVTASTGSGLTGTTQLEFIATDPDAIVVQAEPATVSPGEESNITATVRDANNNLVTGAVVEFTLQDTSGGSVRPAQATTNTVGQVSAVYTSGTTSSSAPAQITARVRSEPTIADTVKVTIGSQALFITLGTGGDLREANDLTKYVYPYTAIVTDAAGNPVPDATFRLNITSIAYQEGSKAPTDTDGDGESDQWIPDYQVSQMPAPGVIRFGCPSEDSNGNGLLDTGEDGNGNGILDPGNVASVPETASLDSSGVAEFDITYPKNFSGWVKVRLRAIAKVEGSENTRSVFFVLPRGTEDHEVDGSAPPGQFSPYGLDGNCATTYDPDTGLE